MLNKQFLLGFILCLFFNQIAYACVDNSKPQQDQLFFDPCPAVDDVALPMPGKELKMVFRRVEVPGIDFWGDEKRLVSMGNAEGGLFQAPQTVMIGGAFPDDKNKNWYYLLGKYEVTKAQFAVVLGDGDIQKGLDRLIEISGTPKAEKELKKLKGNKLDKALAEPVAAVSWYAVQEFIYKYNSWCFKEESCWKTLPTIKADKENAKSAANGFFRLPTEWEWEYAVRGGLAVDRDNLKRGFPFAADEKIERYARVKPDKKAWGIGTREPTAGGFYDLFGNVQEYTADLFQAETGQGKAGGLAVRGGSYRTDIENLSSAFRDEVGFFEIKDGKMEEARPATTGFRLIIASAVIPTLGYKDQIKMAYEDYKNGLRAKTPVGMASNNGIVQAQEKLKKTIDSLEAQMAKEKNKNSDLQKQFLAIRDQLESSLRQLEQSNQINCDSYVEQGVIFSVLMVRAEKDWMRKSKMMEFYEKKTNKSTQDQQNLADLKPAAENDIENKKFYFEKYIDEINKLISCGEIVAQKSLESYAAEIDHGHASEPEKESYNLFRDHYFRFFKSDFVKPIVSWPQEIIEQFWKTGIIKKI